MAVLEKQGPSRTTRLAAELEAHPITVTQRCDALQADGYVRRVSADVFGITEDGRAYLSTHVD
ncbi:hypothetical protein FYC77_01495 [Natrialba swarupiae]|uniref:Uncharacterized protein n=1 Tax=Natrialba swarupiae TaxID=2448032 RepID=A0A5D5AVT8_9EURY|nr:hypothetical protein FYC77_01495 [Natrialba swarupiae]